MIVYWQCRESCSGNVQGVGGTGGYVPGHPHTHRVIKEERIEATSTGKYAEDEQAGQDRRGNEAASGDRSPETGEVDQGTPGKARAT